MSKRYILWFDAIGIGDLPAVGGKNASLGEMIAALSRKGVKVPSGFATTADAYRAYVLENALEQPITRHLDDFHSGKATLQETGYAIRTLFLDSSFPARIADGIASAYVDANTDGVERAAINRRFRHGEVRVICSVRTMTTGVDLPVSCIIDAAPTASLASTEHRST